MTKHKSLRSRGYVAMVLPIAIKEKIRIASAIADKSMSAWAGSILESAADKALAKLGQRLNDKDIKSEEKQPIDTPNNDNQSTNQ